MIDRCRPGAAMTSCEFSGQVPLSPADHCHTRPPYGPTWKLPIDEILQLAVALPNEGDPFYSAVSVAAN